MNTVLQCLATVHANVVFLTTSKHGIGFSMYYNILRDENSEWRKLLFYVLVYICLSKKFVDRVLINCALKYFVLFHKYIINNHILNWLSSHCCCHTQLLKIRGMYSVVDLGFSEGEFYCSEACTKNFVTTPTLG